MSISSQLYFALLCVILLSIHPSVSPFPLTLSLSAAHVRPFSVLITNIKIAASPFPPGLFSLGPVGRGLRKATMKRDCASWPVPNAQSPPPPNLKCGAASNHPQGLSSAQMQNVVKDSVACVQMVMTRMTRRCSRPFPRIFGRFPTTDGPFLQGEIHVSG